MEASIGGGGGSGRAERSGAGMVPSLPPPCPRSPPEYPDLYGKRRGFARVQMLEREISFLEEELKSVEGLEPAFRCCKEVVDFSLGNSDPLMPTYPKRSSSCRGFWKWLCGISWLNFSWICCCCYAFCPPDLDLPCCCSCESCIRCPECRCPSCSFPKWPSSSCCRLRCRLPDCSRPSWCCRNRSCCWIPRIPRIPCNCSRCPWTYWSCGSCPGHCRSCRIGRCISPPKCACECNKCWCPELPSRPCSCFSRGGLRCNNPCYCCY